MSEPTKRDYRVGERVLVEGTIVDWEYGKPYGAVTVRFEAATDPYYLLDGIDAVVPQAIVFADFAPSVDVPDEYIDYTAEEGFYPDE